MLKIFTSLQLRLMDLRDREEGQTFAEYGLILAVIAVIVVGAALLLGRELDLKFDDITSQLNPT